MKAALAALLLLAPPTLQAQEPSAGPPPAASPTEPDYVPPPSGIVEGGGLAPAPEAKAMSAGYVPRYHTRDSWFFGFGAGTGDATAYSARSFATLRDLTGPEPRIGALRLEVGLTLTDRLLLGAEVSGVGTQQEAADGTARVALVNADAVLTFFPEADGLFFRFGGGLSLLHRVAAGASDSYRGYNGVVGLGYAFWVGERFNLSLRIDHTRQRYQDGSAYRTSEQWAGTVGFDWF